MTRYSRQIMLPEIGEEGQRRLSEASVLIVGVGGLGSPVAAYLAGAGVGTIGLADSDTVSLSNLQRQVLYSEVQIGGPKTECAAERLRGLNSDITVRLHPEGLTAENADELIGAYDLTVDCCDNYATRYLIDDVCARLGRRWVYGSIGEFHGQVSVFGDGKRYSDIYADREALRGLPRRPAGVLGAVPGVIGAMEAAQAVELIAGFGNPLLGRLFTIDLKTMQTNLINI
ncbi:MAG: HesA/MoeB/ThiF family protein [Muribaculaceae bacterium]|nr:HesA/MoeB/ThiF family protein [Muribaculaceae bacterium]